MFTYILGETEEKRKKRLEGRFPPDFDFVKWLDARYQKHDINEKDLPTDLSQNHDFYRLKDHLVSV